MDEIKIRKVTQKERILFIIVIIIFSIVFVGLYLYLKHFNTQIMQLALTDTNYALQKYNDLVSKAMITIKIVGLLIGSHFFYISLLSFKSKKFPPDNILIIRDTKIAEGKKATWLAYLTIFYGVLFIFISFYIPYIFQLIINKFLVNM